VTVPDLQEEVPPAGEVEIPVDEDLCPLEAVTSRFPLEVGAAGAETHYLQKEVVEIYLPGGDTEEAEAALQEKVIVQVAVVRCLQVDVAQVVAVHHLDVVVAPGEAARYRQEDVDLVGAQCLHLEAVVAAH